MIDKIYRMDCYDWMKDKDPDIIDLTVTSPPYDKLRKYNGYCFDFEPIAKELFRITKQGGVVVWVVGDQVENGSETGTAFKQILYFMKCGFNLHDTMIYEKNTSSFPSSEKSNRYTQIFEYMFVLSKGTPKTANLFLDKPNKWGGWSTWGQSSKRTVDGGFISIGIGKQPIKEYGVRNNIWRYVCSGGYGQKDKRAYQHPATFPEKLAEDHILSWSNPDDIVFDPFAGSGTSLIMAKEHKRHYIGCEISEEYCKLIEERLENPCTKIKRDSEVVCCLNCDGKGVVSSVQPKKVLNKDKENSIEKFISMPDPKAVEMVLGKEDLENVS